MGSSRRDFGLVRSVNGSLAALGSVLTGVLADGFDWAVAFAVLGALLAVFLCALTGNQALSLGY